MPGLRSRVASLLRTRKAILMLSRVDEIHSAGQGDSSNPGSGRRERTERAWKVLHRFSTLDIVHIGASELVIQRFDKFILGPLGSRSPSLYIPMQLQVRSPDEGRRRTAGSPKTPGRPGTAC